MKNIDIKDVMEKISERYSQNLQQCVKYSSQDIAKNFLNLNIFDYLCRNICYSQNKEILKEVNYDLLSSIYISSTGMYRNSYICLRSALELGLSYFYFLDHNYDFLLWKENRYDLKWATLKDSDKGVVSQNYLSMFIKDFDFGRLIEATTLIYRECSEYVHGKYEYMHTWSDEKIVFQKEEFTKLTDMFSKVSAILSAYLLVRHSDSINKISEEEFSMVYETLCDNEFIELAKSLSNIYYNQDVDEKTA